jgi:hypothetical protein
MASIPGPQKERFYEKKYVVELIAVLPPLVTAAVGALVSLADPAKRILGWWLAGATGWLAVSSAIKVLHAAAQDRDRKRSTDYDGFFGALCVLYEAVRRCVGQERVSDGTLRVTIHRVVPPKKRRAEVEQLEQLLPYVGGTGGMAGRRFSVRSGIIGKAARAKDPFSSTRESDGHSDFVKELIHDWCFTEEDARSVTPDRQSWMAVPVLMTNGTVSVVVSLDSSIPGFFTDEVQAIVLECCGGIKAYIAEVY